MKLWILVALATACGGPVRGPTLYGEGIFSTPAWDFFIAFAPDERYAIFGRADDKFERFSLYETTRSGDGWSPPARPSFATGAWSDADPHLAPDGSAVYFISNRPIDGSRQARPIHDIFVARRAGTGWGDATRLPAPVNDGTTDRWSPAVAASGNLYFGAEIAGTRGGSDLWVSRFVDGRYATPENLGEAINTPAHETEPWIAPDESYLIFAALRRADGVGGYDLFLSRRTPTGWSRAQPLRAINTPSSEWNHSVSPDGRWLYFSSPRKHGKGDIYRISMEEVMPANEPRHGPVTIAPGGAYALAYEVASPARTLYISGQVPARPDGSVPDGIEAQCRLVWENIDAQLAQAGMTRRDLVKVTTYLSDRKYRDVNARIRREVLGDHLPALTIIIAGIYDEAWLLEIEAIASR